LTTRSTRLKASFVNTSGYNVVSPFYESRVLYSVNNNYTRTARPACIRRESCFSDQKASTPIYPSTHPLPNERTTRTSAVNRHNGQRLGGRYTAERAGQSEHCMSGQSTDQPKALTVAAMPELNISQRGLELHGPAAGRLSNVPTQAFPFTMGQDLLESIIGCVEDGGKLELTFGPSPVRVICYLCVFVRWWGEGRRVSWQPCFRGPCQISLANPQQCLINCQLRETMETGRKTTSQESPFTVIAQVLISTLTIASFQILPDIAHWQRIASDRLTTRRLPL
jgi:hypothetical protein